MGFGHRVYKTGDVRARVLKEYARQAAVQAGQTQWEDAAAIIEDVLAKEKNLFPNLDWPAGRLYHSLGLEVPLYTPFFVAARVTGWSAHIMEQLANNRIMRPRRIVYGARGAGGAIPRINLWDGSPEPSMRRTAQESRPTFRLTRG